MNVAVQFEIRFTLGVKIFSGKLEMVDESLLGFVANYA
jgi:hypothetical protein